MMHFTQNRSLTYSKKYEIQQNKLIVDQFKGCDTTQERPLLAQVWYLGTNFSFDFFKTGLARYHFAHIANQTDNCFTDYIGHHSRKLCS